MEVTYWLDRLTPAAWRAFVETGSTLRGFPELSWMHVKRITPGDYLLAYVRTVPGVVGLLEATSAGHWDETPVWADALLPCRVEVIPRIILPLGAAVRLEDLRDELTASPAWPQVMRVDFIPWPVRDGARIIAALEATERLRSMPPDSGA
jgi:hypothetical protein